MKEMTDAYKILARKYEEKTSWETYVKMGR
jgi:hypothetical protein